MKNRKQKHDLPPLGETKPIDGAAGTGGDMDVPPPPLVADELPPFEDADAEVVHHGGTEGTEEGAGGGAGVGEEPDNDTDSEAASSRRDGDVPVDSSTGTPSPSAPSPSSEPSADLRDLRVPLRSGPMPAVEAVPDLPAPPAPPVQTELERIDAELAKLGNVLEWRDQPARLMKELRMELEDASRNTERAISEARREHRRRCDEAQNKLLPRKVELERRRAELMRGT